MNRTIAAIWLALAVSACGGGEETPTATPSGDGVAPVGAPATVAPAGPTAPANGQVCTGDGHTCVLQPTGRVICAGRNLDGALGDGTTQDRASFVPVVGLTDAVDLDCGQRHTCAVRATGQVVCWGRGTHGELGGGTPVAAASTPTVVSGLTDAIEIAAGWSFTCARRAGGAVSCWGAGDDGALGNGSATDSATPVVVTGLADAAEIDLGRAHACARRASGEVVCWGSNSSKQLGQGETSPSSSRAPLAVAGVVGATSLGLGTNHSCAGTAAGVSCWGLNQDGQIGNGTNGSGTNAASAALVPGTAGATAIAAGQTRTCALFGAGETRCWGYNNYVAHLLGITVAGDPRTIDVPTAVPNATDIRSLASGSGHSCGIRASGSLLCWGEGGAGQRGDGASRGGPATEVAGILPLAPAASTIATFEPTPGAVVTVTPTMALGDSHACGIDGEGRVFCFGEGGSGQLGMGSTAAVAAAGGARVPGITDAVHVSASSHVTCVTRANGRVACWGSPGGGDDVFPATSAPVPVDGIEDAVEVAIGNSAICARLRSGAVSCWGANNSGQLGNGTRAASATPGPVTGISDATRIAGGTGTFCALRAGGTVSCWGGSSYGELGQGTTTANPTPTDIPGLARVTALDGSSYDFCAIAGGTVRCWGANDRGQIGNGVADRAAPALAPTEVRGVRGAVQIGVGYANACATNAAGEAFCWGGNTFGQTGHGENEPEAVTAAWQVARDRDPAVAAFAPYAAMDCGSSYCCGLHRDGHFSCAGSTPLGGSGGLLGISSVRSMFPVTAAVTWPVVAAAP